MMATEGDIQQHQEEEEEDGMMMQDDSGSGTITTTSTITTSTISATSTNDSTNDDDDMKNHANELLEAPQEGLSNELSNNHKMAVSNFQSALVQLQPLLDGSENNEDNTNNQHNNRVINNIKTDEYSINFELSRLGDSEAKLRILLENVNWDDLDQTMIKREAGGGEHDSNDTERNQVLYDSKDYTTASEEDGDDDDDQEPPSLVATSLDSLDLHDIAANKSHDEDDDILALNIQPSTSSDVHLNQLEKDDDKHDAEYQKPCLETATLCTKMSSSMSSPSHSSSREVSNDKKPPKGRPPPFDANDPHVVVATTCCCLPFSGRRFAIQLKVKEIEK